MGNISSGTWCIWQLAGKNTLCSSFVCESCKNLSQTSSFFCRRGSFFCHDGSFFCDVFLFFCRIINQKIIIRKIYYFIFLFIVWLNNNGGMGRNFISWNFCCRHMINLPVVWKYNFLQNIQSIFCQIVHIFFCMEA